MSGSMSKSDQGFMRQFLYMVIGLIVMTLLLIFLAVKIYNGEPKEVDPNQAAHVAARIAPAGAVYSGDAGKAAMVSAEASASKAAASTAAYGGTTDGKTIYGNICGACHTPGVAGAPKLGDKAAWAPRIGQGLATLITHATEGYHGPDGNYMPPKGGNPALNDAQIKAVVTYIVDQSK